MICKSITKCFAIFRCGSYASSSVCLFRLILFFSSCPAFPLKVYTASLKVYVTFLKVYTVTPKVYIICLNMYLSKVKFHIIFHPPRPCSWGIAGGSGINGHLFFAQNAPSFRVKQTVCFLPTDYAFSLNGQCVFLRAYVRKTVLLHARIY